jgi:TPR repeat protein
MHLYGGIIILPPKPTKKRKSVAQQQNDLAIAYYRGERTEVDHKEAFKLFKLAAEAGHSFAQLNLAQMYRDGEGTQQDQKAALYWFNQSLLQGNKQAAKEYLISHKAPLYFS